MYLPWKQKYMQLPFATGEGLGEDSQYTKVCTVAKKYFFKDFPIIQKRMPRNDWKILKKCFLVTVVRLWIMTK